MERDAKRMLLEYNKETKRLDDLYRCAAKQCIASWAVPSASALQSAGLELTPLADGTLTRRECAELLYQLSTLCQQDVLDHFRWDS